MIFEKSKTSEKFRGIRTFEISMFSTESGTFDNFGSAEESQRTRYSKNVTPKKFRVFRRFQKIMISRKTGHMKNSGIPSSPGNLKIL